MTSTTFHMLNRRVRTAAYRRLKAAGFRCSTGNQGGCLLIVEHQPHDELKVYDIVFSTDRVEASGGKRP